MRFYSVDLLTAGVRRAFRSTSPATEMGGKIRAKKSRALGNSVELNFKLIDNSECGDGDDDFGETHSIHCIDWQSEMKERMMRTGEMRKRRTATRSS